jgi:hypothetical protein
LPITIGLKSWFLYKRLIDSSGWTTGCPDLSDGPEWAEVTKPMFRRTQGHRLTIMARHSPFRSQNLVPCGTAQRSKCQHTRTPLEAGSKKNAVSGSREHRVGARQPSAVPSGPRHLTFLSVQGVDWGRVLVQHRLSIQPSNFAPQEYKHHGHSRCHHRIRHLHPPRYVDSTLIGAPTYTLFPTHSTADCIL